MLVTAAPSSSFDAIESRAAGSACSRRGVSNEVAETTFSVIYDGPALAQGRMPVRDLAPALLSLGDLFADASTLLYPDRAPAALEINATREGSFDVQLILAAKEGVWDQLVDFFGSDEVTSLANLKELVVGGGIGLFALIKWIRGRTVRSQAPGPEPGQVRLTLDDETTIEVPAEVVTLYRSVGVRKHARKVIEPVTRDGIESLEIRSDVEVSVSIDKADTVAFEPPADGEEVLLEEETELVVSIASVAFKEGNKWRLSDGDRTFHATIEDDAFLDRVDRGLEAFRSGDFLRCRIKIVQAKSEGELHTEYHVLEVQEHIPTDVQLPLSDANDEPEPPSLPP